VVNANYRRKAQVPVQAAKAWKELLIEIEEDYMGSYHFEKNMTLSMVEEEEEKEDL